MKKAMFITTSSQEFFFNMHTTALLSPSTAIETRYLRHLDFILAKNEADPKTASARQLKLSKSFDLKRV